MRVLILSSSFYVSTIAGDIAPGFIDGIGPSARFHLPTDIAIDPAGLLYGISFKGSKSHSSTL
jgi:hypothetical protein